jgi:uncharacterized SAM-binding protein YcdF (DUF218 family)
MTWRCLRQVLGIAVTVSFLASAFTALPNHLAERLAAPERRESADATVVLGGEGIQPDGTLAPSSLQRAVRGIVLFRTGFAPFIVFSGSPAEAEARTVLARSLGVPPEAIRTEGRARTTREEAILIGSFLRSHGVRRILLVSDSYHLRRATILFEQAGFDVLPVPTDNVSKETSRPEARLQLMREIMRELIARLYYRVAGDA